MFIADAKTQTILIKNFQEGSNNFSIFAHRENASFYMKNKDLIPSDDILKQAIDEIEEYVKVILTLEQLKDLLVLYPFVRIDLAVSYGIDSAIRDSLSNMVSEYIIGSKMPIYGDKLTPQEHKMFYDHLHEEAIRVGYKVCIGE